MWMIRKFRVSLILNQFILYKISDASPGIRGGVLGVQE